MFYRNAYGVDLGRAGYVEKFKGPPVAPAEVKPGAVFAAEIGGWREGKTDFSISVRVLDAEGRALINPNWQVALWWPNVTDPGNRPAPTNSRRHPIASLYSLEEALAGIEVRSPQGNVNDEGGAYEMWLDGPDVESPIWRVGWAGNHYYTGPYLVVSRKGGAPPVDPPIPPTPGTSTLIEDIAAQMQPIEEATFKIRERLARG